MLTGQKQVDKAYYEVQRKSHLISAFHQLDELVKRTDQKKFLNLAEDLDTLEYLRLFWEST